MKIPVIIISLSFLASCSAPEDNFEAARKEMAENDYLGAIIYLNTLLKKEPERDDAYALRADCYVHIWKDSMALIDLQRALEVNPQNYAAKLELGRLEFRNNQEDKALQAFEQVLETHNIRLKAEALVELGRIHYFREQYPESISKFEQAIQADPEFPLAWYYHGLVKSRFFDPEGRTDTINYPYLDFDRAFHDFSKAIEKDSTFADAYFQRAMVHFNRFNDSEGMNDLNKTLELAPAYVYYLIARAHQHTLMQRYDEALNDLNSALNKNAKEPELWFERGFYHAAIGKSLSASQDSAQGLRLQKERRPE